MNAFLKSVFFFLFSISSISIYAQLRLPEIFSDHMVFQRNTPILVWGWALPNEELNLIFHHQRRSTKADEAGKWSVLFDSEKAGGPYILSVMGQSKKIGIGDIMVGEVWICSGQSNMEWMLKDTDGADSAIAHSSNNLIRQIKIDHEVSVEPLDDFSSSGWEIAGPKTSPGFSAVAYFFAKKLYDELNVPIGIINSSWGGTMIETWISRSGLSTDSAFAPIARELPLSNTQYLKERSELIQKEISSFQSDQPGEISTRWMSDNYVDTAWSNLKVPGIWEAQGLPVFDGILWYRRDFILTKGQIKNDAILSLDKIDDCDITYLNGIKVGETCAWNKKREYRIPHSVLRSGRNLIAIKVTDYGAGGGLYGDASDIYLKVNDRKIPLTGNWKARVDVNSTVNMMNPNSMPTLLYNAMIHPITLFPVKGVIWYQGESNVDRAAQYNVSFPLLIKDWRKQFNRPTLPFYFVQISSFNANNQNDTTGSKWAELRNAQFNTLKIPNTGMVVTTDIGDPSNIHPRNKRDVGIRLALIALKNDYQKKLVASGPLYKSFQIEKNTIRVRFSDIGSGLKAGRNGGEVLKGFMIAGADQHFHYAQAVIDHTNQTIKVWSNAVLHPVAVRYGWVDDASDANLFNMEGLPASPFRTDNFSLLTTDKVYQLGR